MTMDDGAMRKLWRQWHERLASGYAERMERGYRYPPPPRLVPPADFSDMRCGARTRAGTPCKRRDIYLSGRCKLHGGLSTGPKTEAGKVKASRNGHKRTS